MSLNKRAHKRWTTATNRQRSARQRRKSILTGHRIERAEIGAPGEFDAMSDDELLASIRERFARLDREVRPANNNGSITLNGASDDE